MLPYHLTEDLLNKETGELLRLGFIGPCSGRLLQVPSSYRKGTLIKLDYVQTTTDQSQKCGENSECAETHYKEKMRG